METNAIPPNPISGTDWADPFYDAGPKFFRLEATGRINFSVEFATMYGVEIFLRDWGVRKTIKHGWVGQPGPAYEIDGTTWVLTKLAGKDGPAGIYGVAHDRRRRASFR